ncbi:MAG: hypothetical protein A2231_03065 [Candidatus Firestonebacteria bacterium RIFOXYA2_FULL_40_8]|nr:MAG: hypothetical protein A2231_03065 [Candidatus Firestonebacteria bacterium RIFOXYA2_FULL_40_8]
MIKFWLIAIVIFIAAIFLASFIVNLLKLSFAIFKAILIILLILAIFFVVLYYTGLLEKIPFLNELFLKFKEIILPNVRKAVGTVT